jgi:rubrerythrin
MDKIDPAKAARVWQRVQSNTPVQPREQGLLELIAQELTDAATYLHLSRRFQGKDSAILRKIFTEEQSHAACLKGIYTLITGKHPTVRVLPPTQDDPEKILRRCYGREMQCLAHYEQRSDDPEYGQVFARLAAQERDHCRLILELLGNLKKKK